MKIPKLKLKLWQELVYYVFVGIGPIVITSLELFNSRVTWFKISFASVGCIFIVYWLLKYCILNKYVNKLKQRIVMLEHDYSIQCGNPALIKQQWKIFNFKIYMINCIQIVLTLGLLYMFITALIKQIIAFMGAASIIFAMIIIGMVFRAACYISIKVKE